MEHNFDVQPPTFTNSQILLSKEWTTDMSNHSDSELSSVGNNDPDYVPSKPEPTKRGRGRGRGRISVGGTKRGSNNKLPSSRGRGQGRGRGRGRGRGGGRGRGRVDDSDSDTDFRKMRASQIGEERITRKAMNREPILSQDYRYSIYCGTLLGLAFKDTLNKSTLLKDVASCDILDTLFNDLFSKHAIDSHTEITFNFGKVCEYKAPDFQWFLKIRNCSVAVNSAKHFELHKLIFMSELAANAIVNRRRNAHWRKKKTFLRLVNMKDMVVTGSGHSQGEDDYQYDDDDDDDYDFEEVDGNVSDNSNPEEELLNAEDMLADTDAIMVMMDDPENNY